MRAQEHTSRTGREAGGTRDQPPSPGQKEGSFKAAEARYTDIEQVDTKSLKRWLAKARDIQWDYKNIARRKGRLQRIK